MTTPGSLSAGIPAHLPEELVEVLASSHGTRVERIVSRGHASPEGFWFDQEQDEFVLLVRGRAGLRFEGREEVVLEAGGHVTIPAHTRHRVEWTDPDGDTVWVVVYFRAPGNGDS